MHLIEQEAYGSYVCQQTSIEDYAAKVVDIIPTRDDQSHLLTNRELEILDLIVQEYSSKQVAAELNISIHTVLTHRKNIKTKLGVKGVVGMVRVWLKRQMVLQSLIALLALSLCMNELSAQQCSNMNITLLSQSDVDNFQSTYGVCDSLPAILRIGNGNITDIYNLTPLSNLRHVSQLIVTNNDNLLSLEGLENLNQNSISRLSITGNLLLNDISQLSGIGPIGGDLGIADNPALATLDGLENLRIFGTAITIRNMPLLTSLSPMTGITRIDGFLTIENNDALTDISALSSLAIFGDGANPRFVVKDNDALEDCTPLCYVVQTVLPRLNNLTKDIQNNLGNCLDEQAILIDCIDENDGIYSGSGTVPANTDVGLENSISIDNSTLVIDGLNNRVGIGTSTPQAVLEVDGTVRLSGLPTSGSIDKIIAIDTDGHAFEYDISNYDADASDDFSGTFADLTGVPAGLSDGDDDTQLSDAQIAALGYIKSANDADSDPTNELYDDSDLVDSITVLRSDLTALQSSGGNTSLYSSDGSLISDRAVTQGDFDINFDANTLVVDGSDNKVGIGTSTPTYELDVIGDVGISGAIFGLSDERLKRDIVPIQNALAVISQLAPKSYWFKSDEFKEIKLSETKQYGLIAQDVHEVLPDIISTTRKGEEVYQAINYQALITVLISAMQEQHEIINSLEQKWDEAQKKSSVRLLEIEELLRSSSYKE